MDEANSSLPLKRGVHQAVTEKSRALNALPSMAQALASGRNFGPHGRRLEIRDQERRINAGRIAIESRILARHEETVALIGYSAIGSLERYLRVNEFLPAWNSDSPEGGKEQSSQTHSRPRISREMISRWTSEVPSPISVSFTSRKYRSTG